MEYGLGGLPLISNIARTKNESKSQQVKQLFNFNFPQLLNSNKKLISLLKVFF